MAYNPSQPRAPKGTDIGGQWINQAISFSNMSAAGTALGDRIEIDRFQYGAMSTQARKELISHELAHNVVEDLIYKSPEEWSKATEALLLSKKEKGNTVYFEFMQGQMRFGEAIVSAITSYVNDLPDPMDVWTSDYGSKPWTSGQWKGMLDWAKHALSLAGYTKESFNRQVEYLIKRLDEES